jgi:hypothetical protein
MDMVMASVFVGSRSAGLRDMLGSVKGVFGYFLNCVWGSQVCCLPEGLGAEWKLGSDPTGSDQNIRLDRDHCQS